MNAIGGGAGNAAVGDDLGRAGAKIVSRDAGLASRDHGAGGHGEIGSAAFRTDAVFDGGSNAAIGGDFDKAAAIVEGIDTKRPTHDGGSSGHREIGGTGVVVRLNASPGGACDVAIGGDGQSAGAEVASPDAPIATKQGAVSVDGDAARRSAVIASSVDVKSAPLRRKGRRIRIGIGERAVAGDGDGVSAGATITGPRVDRELRRNRIRDDVRVVDARRARGQILRVAAGAVAQEGTRGTLPQADLLRIRASRIARERAHEHGRRQQQLMA